jgi:hypothetical protein
MPACIHFATFLVQERLDEEVSTLDHAIRITCKGNNVTISGLVPWDTTETLIGV